MPSKDCKKCEHKCENESGNVCFKFGVPIYTCWEEIINYITHALGVILSAVSFVLFLKNPQKNLICNLIYSSTLFILYLSSTIYHGLKMSYLKKIFRILDHCSIFLLIAGTYVPIALIAIGNLISKIILLVIWVTAILGIIFNCINIKKFSKFSMICYLAMGWAIIFAIKPIMNNFSVYQIWMFITGGAMYTSGAVLYSKGRKIRYMHSIWHIFVLAGSIFHFLMILSL
ncbi:MAG: hemolysin III family protein [Candidatus Paraimprobicoccus trichonymphae]|uniref:Hemolysin III family protein n=1 Tax=Candidatus Paraimprobicoccus trichonymphae TaxID=3033793 RepID=A0AA48IHM5_9FIRM|nr:MAG: hemolysin III family protein [Candidatus Paraimprobicoccus trichonymphae]